MGTLVIPKKYFTLKCFPNILDAKKLSIEKHFVQCSTDTYGKGRSIVFKGVLTKEAANSLNVAVKKIKMEEFSIQEINSLVDVQHENVIELFGHFFDKPYYNLILEPATCNLEELLLNRDGKFNELKMRIGEKQILLDSTKGLNYIHSKNFIHFDLKPENILLVDRETLTKAVIADFGKSKQNKSFSRSMTVTKTQMGTIVSSEVLANWYSS